MRQKLGMTIVTQLANRAANPELLASASFMEELGKDSAMISRKALGNTAGQNDFSPQNKTWKYSSESQIYTKP